MTGKGPDAGLVTHQRMAPPATVATVPSNTRRMAAARRTSLTLIPIVPLGAEIPFAGLVRRLPT